MKLIDLTIVIPAYNESTRIGSTLTDLYSYLRCASLTTEVIVVDDGSSDDTASHVASLSDKYSFLQVIELGQNQGKGSAIKVGMLKAQGATVMFLDADGSTPAVEIERLYAHIFQPTQTQRADVVIGSRALASEDTNIKTSFHRKALGRLFNALVNMLAVPNISDTQCGFKMFSRDATQFLFSRQLATGFSFDVEILMIAQKSGMKIVEVPINWNNVEGSKVNLFKDSLKMLCDVLRFRKLHRNVDKFSRSANLTNTLSLF
jgi:dolichyl-phosphate beta-glucosyltransferase